MIILLAMRVLSWGFGLGSPPYDHAHPLELHPGDSTQTWVALANGGSPDEVCAKINFNGDPIATLVDPHPDGLWCANPYQNLPIYVAINVPTTDYQMDYYITYEAVEVSDSSCGGMVCMGIGLAGYIPIHISEESLRIDIGDPSTILTKSGPVTYLVTYNYAHGISLTLADVTLNKTGTADGVVVDVSGTSNIRTVTIFNITGDGTLGISIEAGTAHDSSGNQAPSSGHSPTFVVDSSPTTIPPTLSAVHIGSSNANSSEAKVGDRIALTIDASANLHTPTATIAGYPVIVTGTLRSWTADYVLTDGDSEGVVPFAVFAYTDSAGNQGNAVTATTDGRNGTINSDSDISGFAAL